MSMKGKILIRIMSKNYKFIAETCWPDEYFQNINVIAESRSKAISEICGKVIAFIEDFGIQYIQFLKSNRHINCQQGRIELPIDLWYCKNTKTACPIQANIDKTNPEEFFKQCLLNKRQKEGIWKAITENKYIGFHHIPGRYRCRLCKPGKVWSYYYPWELTLLEFHCDIYKIWNNPKRRHELILKNFPCSAMYSALCCKHFKEVSSKFLPEIDLSNYGVLVVDINDSNLKVNNYRFVELKKF